MSVAGISSSSLFSVSQQSLQNSFQNNISQFQQEFQQLGQDLQSGNLSAAQSDFTALQQLAPSNTTASSTQSNPITQAFSQLSQDLQSGNLTAAQQDYQNIQQDFQNQTGQAQGHPHHHHYGGGGGEENGSNSVNQLFQELGQELQSGNTAAAQQTYNSLLQDFQQSGQPTQTLQPQPGSGSSISLTA